MDGPASRTRGREAARQATRCAVVTKFRPFMGNVDLSDGQMYRTTDMTLVRFIQQMSNGLKPMTNHIEENDCVYYGHEPSRQFLSRDCPNLVNGLSFALEFVTPDLKFTYHFDDMLRQVEEMQVKARQAMDQLLRDVRERQVATDFIPRNDIQTCQNLLHDLHTVMRTIFHQTERRVRLEEEDVYDPVSD